MLKSLSKSILSYFDCQNCLSPVNQNKHKEWDKPIPISNKEKINSILTETSTLNSQEDQRLIPGIKYAEYFFPVEEDEISAHQDLKHSVLIDTPGVGASIIRHSLILREEVKNADAVVLVLRADRINTDSALKTTELLDKSLFENYSSKEKIEFAKKVFLIANQADRLSAGQGNQKAVERSMADLCNIISPDYWERYGKNSSQDRRIFQTMSLLALLSSQKQLGIDLDDNSKDLLSSQLTLLRLDKDTTKSENLNKAIETSQVPAFSRQLGQFLSHQRIALMLAEGRSYTNRAEEQIKVSYQEVFKSQDSQIDINLLNDSQPNNEIKQTICQDILDKDLKELKQVIENLIISINDWRKNKTQDQQSMKSDMDKINNSIENSLKDYIQKQINQEKKHIYTKTWDDLEGKPHPEGLPKKLLLETQTHFHEQVEEKSEQIAECYLKIFEEQINKQKIYEKFQTKTYNQSYCQKIDPTGEIKKYQNKLNTEYKSIFRWILMYELVKMPIPVDESSELRKNLKENNVILNFFQKASTNFQNVSRNFQDNFDTEQLTDNVADITINLIVDYMIPSPIDQFIKAVMESAKTSEKDSSSEEDSSSSQQPNTSSQQTNTSTDKKLEELSFKENLVPKIKTYLENKYADQCAKLMKEAFLLRYQLTLGTALIYLEILFRHELGKFRRSLEALSDKLINSHKAHVEVETENINIQDVLIEKALAKDEQVSQAYELMVNLQKYNTSKVNEPEMGVEQKSEAGIQN